jgi:hypothetical protein
MAKHLKFSNIVANMLVLLLLLKSLDAQIYQQSYKLID